MKPERDGPKLGAGHAQAMFRQGLKELRGAMYPESNVAQPTEYGVYGTQTPGEVAEARREEPEPGVSIWEQEGGSILRSRLEKAEAKEPADRDDRNLDMER